MPNDCENILIIKNYDQDFLQKHFDKDRFLFDTIIPEPRYKMQCDSKYHCSDHLEIDRDRPWFDWYNWHLDFWNTKWGAYNCSYNIENNDLYIYFDTAWTPPIPICLCLQEMYPDSNIELLFYEPGCCIAGEVTCQGDVLDHYNDDQWIIDNGFEVEGFRDEEDVM